MGDPKKPWQETWTVGTDGDGAGIWFDGAWFLDGPSDEGRRHLASAAPDLYRALERMLRAEMKGDTDAYEQAEAALRKARGEV